MDENLQNQVDKLFRESLQSYRDKPSVEIWDNIENQLDKEDDRLFKTRTNKRFWITAGIFLVLSCAGTFTLFNFHSNKNISVKNIQKKNYDSVNSVNNRVHQILTLPGTLILNSEEKYKGAGMTELNPGNRNNFGNKTSSYIGNSIPKFLNYLEINDFSLPEFYPLNIKAPVPKLYSIQFEKFDYSENPNIPENLIIKPEKYLLKNRLSITPYFSQEFAGYSLSDDDATAADGQEIENRERNVFSASLGIYLNYKMNKRWVIQSGISYSWSSSIIDSATSYAVKDNSGNVQFKLNTISGYGFLQPSLTIQPSVGDSVLTAKAYSQLHYLTVPLILSYKIPMNRFSLLVGAGISFNLLTGAAVETKIYGPNLDQDLAAIPIKGLKNINYGIIVKADLEYHINSSWGVNLIPCFKNSLSPINIHSALSAYPYNFGIGAGITYRF
jgi:Outer membrane protein beta-barrel domain